MEFTMTAPLSRDLRERIVRFVEGGASVRQAGLRFEVSPSAAIKLMQRVRKTGSTVPAKIGGYRKPILEPHAETLRAIVESNPGMTLKGDARCPPCARHRGEGALDHLRHAS